MCLTVKSFVAGSRKFPDKSPTCSRRWLEEEPVAFQAGDSNLFRYAFNAPTEHTDPSGQQVPKKKMGPSLAEWSMYTSQIRDAWAIYISDREAKEFYLAVAKQHGLLTGAQ